MSREQFFAKLESLAEERLRQVLWELYYKGSDASRERIDVALLPPAERAAKIAEKAAPKIPNGALVADEVRDFVRLARSGAYIGGTREVARSERSRWRFTYRKLIDGATTVLEAGDLEHGVPAVENLLDLAHQLHGYNYFRSEDPVEAMKLVFSDEVEKLWRATLKHEGFEAFVRRAAPQLLRWESLYGWTRSGGGPTAEHERPLADVVSLLLVAPDHWFAFFDEYMRALDGLVRRPSPPERTSRKRVSSFLREREERERSYERERRSRRLEHWHRMILERLDNYDAEDRIVRLLEHPALGGAEHDFLRARHAHRSGRVEEARALMTACLEHLPGHQELIEFSKEIGATLPARAKEVLARNMRLAGVAAEA